MNKVYLAGKIKQNCWRHDIFPGIRNAFHGHDIENHNLNLVKKNKDTKLIKKFGDEEFQYTGPFFIGCDHGCFHGQNTHGCGVYPDSELQKYFIPEEKCGNCEVDTIQVGDEFIDIDENDTPEITIDTLRYNVVLSCQEAIMKSQYVFCWIDSPDAYGTIFELGYAQACGKECYITIDKKLKDSKFDNDIWFTKQSAGACNDVKYFDNPMDAWNSFTRYVNLRNK